MSLSNALESRASDADWQLMAKHAGISPEELKSKVLKALVDLDTTGHSDEAVVHSVSAPTQSGDCQTQSFEVSLFKIIGISGELTLCGSNSTNWSAELKFCLVVAGSKVWCTSYKFDPHNLSVCFSPSVGLAKADLCFALQIENGKACLNVSGKACVWGFGWKCGKFNKTLFCIPLP